MKKILIILLIALVIIFGVWYFWPTETVLVGSPEAQMMVEDYFNLNLGQISPEPEVLGGTFFLTEINFTGPDTGLVSYEDGHNAYAALFSYQITGGDVEITSFELLPNR